MTVAVNVYLGGFFVGNAWRDGDGQLLFKYYPGWLESSGRQPLSLRLPLRPDVYGDAVVRPFLSGILPEQGARHRLAQCLDIDDSDILGLLAAIGGDCPGRISFSLPQHGPEHVPPGQRPLDDRILTALPEVLAECPFLAGEQSLRLCLPGSGRALPVVQERNRFSLPLGERSSTHVLKTAPFDRQAGVANEALCLALAAKAGVPVQASMQVATSREPLLLVQRADRSAVGADGIQRLGAESLGQALGIANGIPIQDSGVFLQAGFQLLKQVGVAPIRDQKRLLQWSALQWVFGNEILPVENITLLRQGQGWGVAPFYGLVGKAEHWETPAAAASEGGDNGWNIGPARPGPRPRLFRKKQWARFLIR